MPEGASERTRAAGQWKLLLILVALYALVAAIYVLIPGGGLAMASGFEGSVPDVAPWLLALANAAFILGFYAVLGLAGLWLARRADLPGVYRPGAGLRGWLWRPLGVGLAVGLALVLFDLLARQVGGFAGFAHPPFPASLLASFAAGVGEEIVFRLFLMSLWTAALGWLAERLAPGRRTRRLTLWLANGLAALAFAAGHFATATVLVGVSSPLELPPIMLAELVVLNALVGLLAGESFARDGLIAAAGVHFWTDVVWHVLFGLVG